MRGFWVQVYFDVTELYYMPQYSPICTALTAAGVDCCFVFYKQAGFDDLIPSFREECEVRCVGSVDEAVELYQSEKPDWVIFGNKIHSIEKVQAFSKTALVSHGIGPKSCYYTVSDMPTTVRFVEGPYRLYRLEGMYPNQTFIDTGYAKLDPAINGKLADISPSTYGLDDNKKTLLYAPTFYPSSIERFSLKFPEDFSEYNIVLKPHFFSMSITKYEKQKVILETWAKYPNVYLAGIDESNILPFMVMSDVLISDASSTLFEFAALDKPVVWCDFLKLRWAYRGILKFRFKQRMDQDLYKYADIAAHAQSYSQLRNIVDEQIANPNQYAAQRAKYTLSLAGKVDGKVSERIVNYMLQNSDL